MAKAKKNMSENSLKNLIPVEKGNTLGKGRPKGSRNVKTVLSELMEVVLNDEHIDGTVKEMTVLEMLHIKMIEQVKKHGNVAAYKALLDRFEGAVKPMEEEGDNKQPVNFITPNNGTKLYEDESDIEQ
jgi:hypothetical protein